MVCWKMIRDGFDGKWIRDGRRKGEDREGGGFKKGGAFASVRDFIMEVKGVKGRLITMCLEGFFCGGEKKKKKKKKKNLSVNRNVRVFY